MLYQFHDCLPGSAIDRVYAQTQARYAQLHLEALHRIEEQKQFLAAGLNADGIGKACCRVQSGTGGPYRVPGTGRQGAAGQRPRLRDCRCGPEYGAANHPDGPAGTDSGKMIGSGCLSAWMGPWTASTTNAPDRKCSCGPAGNRLVCFPDENTHWDIEKAYLDRPGQPARLLTMERYDRGPDNFLHITFQVGKSIHDHPDGPPEQNSARVDFRTEVNWQEEYQMLRVRWPVDVVAESAACDIQFGHVFRPTHHNTSWDQAKFGVCAHKWADISDRSGAWPC